MAEYFIITGLPRSRTAWMAALMSTGDAICFHEPIGDIDDVENFLKSVRNFPYVGISDSGLGFYLERLIHEINPRILIINRDIRDVEDSIAAINPGFPRTNYCELLRDELNRVDDPCIKRIAYSSLNNETIMRGIVTHLAPGLEFDSSRFKILCQTNIQVPVPEMIQKGLKGHLVSGIRGLKCLEN